MKPGKAADRASKPEPLPGTDPIAEWLPATFAGLFGAFLGLALLKFGNPPITEKYVTAPTDVYGLVFSYPWPITWAYLLLALVSLAGLAVARWRLTVPGWVLALPLVWLAWQAVAAAGSVDSTLSNLTFKHFVTCLACFYLGYFSLRGGRGMWAFWLAVMVGFVLVLVAGWDQRFGGLEATRRYFYAYVYPQVKEVPPEYLKKINSCRIFGTLFYPNTLAGALLLLLPPLLAAIWQLRRLLTLGARAFLMGVLSVGAFTCLFWSGSKGGWLLMLLLGLLMLLRIPFSRKLKVALLALILMGGLAGFFVKYAAFFKKGATSVSARFDYWRAAAQTAGSHPAVGTGPGTFAIPYQKIKRPESEMARLVHNDYLEQASDSGLPGFLAYAAFIVAALSYGFPRRGPGSGDGETDWLRFGVWLGALGWSMQGLVEFGLYIPALAWPAFTFLGWLLATRAGGVAKS